ncbi:MAG: 4-(cytidine 5'-diphospho)-2-C-methyl-D-erythritol kinase [Bacteroidales bacterium]|nr:4-(cytidine 5'-diphospho)-2-C-methyl-D-erythritol kinase [Bacteroidales bacterium]
MICFPNAKINIGLHIISRREDGYHNLETLFYPIGLKDALEIIPTRETKGSHPAQEQANKKRVITRVTGLSTGPEPWVSDADTKYRLFQTGLQLAGNPEDNLVIKAWQLMATHRTLPPIDIHLLKKIPSGAGLGGGSSNAAFMLQLLNNNFSLGLSNDELAGMAATLGADCAFFIRNQPALASGIGDVLEPFDLDLSGYFLLLVKPDISIATKEAYSLVTPKIAELSLREIVKKPVSEWKEWLKNDFEPVIFKKYPEIYRIKKQLYDLGAVYASMSGSGSSVYGLFREEPEWQNSFREHFVWSNK